MKKIVAAILLFACLLGTNYAQKFDGLALTPPMGWNSWNTFAIDINEQLVKDIADVFVEKGFKDAGYMYVVLDDAWMAIERDENGMLVPDPVKFPNGMKAVADYVHSKGLKFGLYNCAGNKTCAGYPGSRGHEYQDARQYAEWGIDYLKYDWCNTGKINAVEAYTTMRDALKAAGRPVVFSICEWGDNQPWTWAKDIGHLWRISGDIVNCWDCEYGHGNWSSWGLWRIINMRSGIRAASGPDHWNDFDMMEVGNGMSAGEDRVHFAMWCMLASPLILGNDLRTASEETIATLTNKEVIAVNQDALGIQGFRYLDENGFEIWVKPLANDDWAVVFVNMKEEKRKLKFDWKKHPIEDAQFQKWAHLEKDGYKVRDLFGKRDLGTTANKLEVTIPGHDLLMVKLTKN